MIYNDQQLRVTSGQLVELKKSLESIEASSSADVFTQIQLSAISSQIYDLQKQIDDYNSLLTSGPLKVNCSDLSELPFVLVKCRIANFISQKELAERVGLSELDIIRFENSKYSGVDQNTLMDISKIVGVTISDQVLTSASQKGISFNKKPFDWSLFPIKEMAKRGWISLKGNVSPEKQLQEFFFSCGGSNFLAALHKKQIHGGNNPNRYALIAWQARVLQKAKLKVDSYEIGKFSLDDSWINELIKLSVKDDAPLLVQQLLAKHGIILVVEPHLQGTYLDGAAMLFQDKHPVIALTLRHDRLDNFWFALMHELGHVFLHLYTSMFTEFFDEEDQEVGDRFEIEANDYALENTISKEKWDSCLSRFYINEETVLADATNLGIHPSIVAGRIRKELTNYSILSSLVGQGKVRLYFGI
ncbi:XRE family transcriptional regulator [Rheinheimera nanhaiensis]|uniref:Helix-turn-helix domain-containing protein n=1 Tax=Rheinheimera nanhaiensis E407-8 TaxID=562729 RepID=I1DY84_9GAMM|nr:XRE family transcriptional regulator [Rheinheimera nanhaiensis]GAB59012.1 helix-turn-helix domain-containing protein [Rheinheimera nanhaiensis E407-8]